MQFVDRPPRYDSPGSCIITHRPYDENGGVLLDGMLDGVRGDIRLWVSYAGGQLLVERMGERMNLAKRDHLLAAKDAATALQQRLDQVEAERDEALAKLSRIQGVAKDGFKVQRQQGRPPMKQVTK